MTSKNITTLQAPKPHPKKFKGVHSLQVLKGRNAHTSFDTTTQPPSGKNSAPKKKRHICLRCILWLLGIFLSIFLILSSGLAYLTSPMGEGVLTSCVEAGVNYLGKPLGLRIQLATIRGFWEGKIQIYDLRVFDNYGPWLRISEGTLHPQWPSLFRSTVASFRYRQDKTIPKTFFNNNKPLASLPQIQNDTFTLDGAKENQQLDTRKDYIESLLSAEQVLQNRVTIGLKLGTLVDVYMPRFPKYASTAAQKTDKNNDPLQFLPSWLAIDVGEIELASFQLGPTGRSITFSTRMHGQINDTQIRLRTTLVAAKDITSQLILPTIQELPADITLSFKQLKSISDTLTESFVQARKSKTKDTPYIIGFFSMDYNQGDVDLRWQCRDSILTPTYLTGAKSFWSRARILAQVNTWPPTKENPFLARAITRFGMSLHDKEQRIKASLLSGQVLWDGSSIILRDFAVQSPIKEPSFTASGSVGFSPDKGFGSQLTLNVNNIQRLATMIGVDLAAFPLAGAVNSDFYVSRGGDYMLWWAKPFPDFQKNRTLYGFKANPHDFSIIAKHVQTYTKSVLGSLRTIEKARYPQPATHTAPKQATALTHEDKKSPMEASIRDKVEKISHDALPKPSTSEDGLRFRLKVESKELTLPQGTITDLFYTLHGTSADSLSMPRGTAYTRETPEEKIVSDFTQDILPRGIVGTSFLRMGNIAGYGSGTLTYDIFVGGAHYESDVFQTRINNLSLQLPGIKSDANLSFAYALPRLKRRWPWVDGNFYLEIDNWELIKSLTKSSLNMENLKFSSAFKSFVDELGSPAQYMNIYIDSGRIDSPAFMVRQAQGASESKHLHALADAVGLSIGKLRDALTRKMEYTPPADYPIFTANLNLASGRGGPVRWNNGIANVRVAGEQANFNVRMLGEINALLEGLFKFRTRTLELNDVKISTPQAPKK